MKKVDGKKGNGKKEGEERMKGRERGKGGKDEEVERRKL
jgi:hypothetical protein